MRRSLLVTPILLALVIAGGVSPVYAESFRSFGVQTIVSPDRPSAIAVNPLTNMVYTIDSGDGPVVGRGGTVTVINGNTNGVVGTPIPVGSAPYAIVADPTNNSVYVSDSVDGTITVISGDIPRVTQVISLVADFAHLNEQPPDVFYSGTDVSAYGLAFDPVTNRVYVATRAVVHLFLDVQISSIWYLDTSTNTLVTRADFPQGAFGDSPAGLAVNPVTGLVYMALPDDDVVEVRDGTSLKKVSEIPAMNKPATVGLNSVTNTVYVPDTENSTVKVVDGTTNTVKRVIDVGSHPFGVGVNELTNTVYVPNTRGDSVAVIDGTKNELTGTPINVGRFPVAVAVNAARRSLFVANQGDSTVSAISERMTPDITSGTPVAGAVGVFYSFTIRATGSPQPTFTVSLGVLPPGLTLNSTTGVIAGRPLTAGSYTFTIKAHNATNFDQTKTYTLVIGV